MAEACEILKTPVVSGNVSLYNETKETSIFPTPVVGMVGLIEEIDYFNDFTPKVGDTLYVVGDTFSDFGGSQIEKLLFSKVNHEVETIDLSNEVKRGESIKRAIRNGIASHVQTVGKGGLLMTFARISAHYQMGLNVTLNLKNEQLFSETQGRYVVAVKGDQPLDIADAIKVGTLTEDGKFVVSNGDTLISRDVKQLNEQWEGAIPKCMTTTD